MIYSRFFPALLCVIASPLLFAQQDQDISPSMRQLMEASRPSILANPKAVPSIPEVLLITAALPSAFENVNLVAEGRGEQNTQNESSIAVNPLNPQYLIASAVDYRNNSSTWVYVSSNGGKTWVNKNLGTPPGLGFTSSNDPSVAWDYEGRGYLVYGGFDRTRTKGENGVFIAVTTDNGETWKAHTPVILHKGTMTKDSAFEDKYYIVADNASASPYRGHLYIPWKRVYDRDSSTQIVITKSTDHGATWSTPLRISNILTGKSLDTTFGQSFPIIATGPNGEVYCAWNYGPLHSIGFNKSTDGGKTWGEPRLPISYQWLGVTKNTGSQYNHTLKNGTRVETYPSLTVDVSNSPRKGWLYLTWAADKTPNIYFARSTDGGTTWSTPKIIHSDTTNDQYWQWISVDVTNGDIAVMYLDSRDDPANLLSRCYVSYSSDGGDTWIDRRTGDEGFDIHRNPFQGGSFAGDYSGCAFHAGKVYPSHVDMRNTTSSNFTDNDVYTTLVAVRAPLPVENFAAKTLLADPTKIALSWNAPTQRSFGQPLNKNEYSYALYRDGAFLNVISSADESYTDSGLPPFSKHSYAIEVVASGDTSAKRLTDGYAGGSPQPGKPTLNSVNNGNQTTASLSVQTPSLRADGVNPLQNLKHIIIYRDSVKVAEIEVSANDTNKVLPVNDNVPERGYYSYAVSVRDSYGNESERTEATLLYIGPVDPTWQDNFDAAKMARYLVRGGWELTDEFALSGTNSLTESKRRQYNSLAKDTLTFFPLKVATVLRLSFKHAVIVQPGDTAIVEVKVDNNPWTTLARFNKNDFTAWRDGELNAADWKPEVLPVNAPALSIVVVRFRFTANIINHDDGWFVDDLSFNGETSTAEEDKETEMMLYPNPASHYVRLWAQEVQKVELISMLGQTQESVQIAEQQSNSMLFDVSGLATGTYLVRIYHSKGVEQSLLKIIR